jgi:glycosyltransferase involved in cell wall biosynthesis
MVPPMNKISLVIATYQANIAMLHQALECSDLFDEVIIHINDKETAYLANLPKNCRVIYQEDRCTVQNALNVAIDLSTSNYILPWTDDDFFDRKALIEVLNYASEHNGPEGVIYYPIYTGSEAEWKLWSEPEISFEKLLDRNLIPFSSIYHKSVWRSVGGYKLGEYSDWFFWLEVMKAGYKFKFINTPVYYHRHGHRHTLSNKEKITFNKEDFIKRLNNGRFIRQINSIFID